MGVSPNAAYRHFADRASLLRAVADEVTVRMAEQMRAHAHSDLVDPGERARDLLRAVGLGYVDFARAEPGWFAVAFFAAREGQQPGPEGVAAREPAPYRLLVEALDGLVAAGLVEPGARTAALWACWSTVHGFAELAIHGPCVTPPTRRCASWPPPRSTPSSPASSACPASRTAPAGTPRSAAR